MPGRMGERRLMLLCVLVMALGWVGGHAFVPALAGAAPTLTLQTNTTTLRGGDTLRVTATLTTSRKQTVTLDVTITPPQPGFPSRHQVVRLQPGPPPDAPGLRVRRAGNRASRVVHHPWHLDRSARAAGEHQRRGL